jgi:glycosyltransferase involved in cell wall biosynthesis
LAALDLYKKIMFNKNPPIISIITPVYNGSQYLEEHIKSVFLQDYPFIEHIIIDDGSTDDGKTIEILKRYPHLKWWSRENRGQYATINEGLERANGEIIGIISSDDNYILPSTFSLVVDCWQSSSNFGCIYGRTRRIDSEGKFLPLDPTVVAEPFPIWRLKYSVPLLHCSMFVNKKILTDRKLYFDTSFRYAADWDWIIRLSQAMEFKYLDREFSLYREHEAQTTQRVGQKLLKVEVKKVLKKNKISFQIYWILMQQHRILKALWILKTSGLTGLKNAYKSWLKVQ